MDEEEKKEEETATLTFPDGRKYPIQIKQGTCGPPVLDCTSLYADTGYLSHDPGFTSTSSCNSEITFIDGEVGQLLHRGYRIQDLAENCNYIETCYLLLYGELPNQLDLQIFDGRIKNEMCIHENLISYYKAFTSNAHPMAIMVGVVGALSAFMPSEPLLSDHAQRERVAIRIVAKMPMIAAVAYRTAMGLPVVYPKREFGYAKNFLYMMYADPMSDTFDIDPLLVDALEKILVLHADHEQNASTSTVRIAGSSLANPYACIAAGIASLWGPMHGGANEAVLAMLREVGGEENIDDFFEQVTVKRSIRLMGFGHRVYKNFDPRADPIKKIAHQMQQSSHINIANRKLLDLAIKIEQRALTEEFFTRRKLFPNVDFYSGIVLEGLGIPVSMFTVIFALSRSIGWITQWKESMNEQYKIQRPRQLYVGQPMREFVEMADRKGESLISQDEEDKRRPVMSPKKQAPQLIFDFDKKRDMAQQMDTPHTFTKRNKTFQTITVQKVQLMRDKMNDAAIQSRHDDRFEKASNFRFRALTEYELIGNTQILITAQDFRSQIWVLDELQQLLNSSNYLPEDDVAPLIAQIARLISSQGTPPQVLSRWLSLTHLLITTSNYLPASLDNLPDILQNCNDGPLVAQSQFLEILIVLQTKSYDIRPIFEKSECIDAVLNALYNSTTRIQALRFLEEMNDPYIINLFIGKDLNRILLALKEFALDIDLLTDKIYRVQALLTN